MVSCLTFLMISGSPVQSEEVSHQKEGDLTLEFEQETTTSTTDSVQSSGTKESSKEILTIKEAQKLPKTGEMVGSLLIILTGLACLIAVIAIIVLRRIRTNGKRR